MSAEDDWTEEEYVEYLEHERHMYAWCLVTLAGFPLEAAQSAALERYPFEPQNPLRGMVFHDQAWHWAMLRIHGNQYWLKHRGLEVPTAEYRAESARIGQQK